MVRALNKSGMRAMRSLVGIAHSMVYSTTIVLAMLAFSNGVRPALATGIPSWHPHVHKMKPNALYFPGAVSHEIVRCVHS
jgi:hypothetical protein